MISLLWKDDVPCIAVQQVEEAPPLVGGLETVDVEAEEAQGRLLPGSHRRSGRRLVTGGPNLVSLWLCGGGLRHHSVACVVSLVERRAGGPARAASAAIRAASASKPGGMLERCVIRGLGVDGGRCEGGCGRGAWWGRGDWDGRGPPISSRTQHGFPSCNHQQIALHHSFQTHGHLSIELSFGGTKLST
jgi:hypothetical protein